MENQEKRGEKSYFPGYINCHGEKIWKLTVRETILRS